MGNHDDRTAVTAFINALNGLVVGRPFAVVILAHPGKGQGSEYSGSVAWENAVRMRWFLGDRLPDQPLEPGDEGSDRSTVRYLCKRKSNYSAKDYVRFSMCDGVLVPDQLSTQVDGAASALDERRADQVCVAAFKSLKAMGLHPADSPSSGDYLPKQALVKGLASGFGKSDMVRAMNRLMSRGVFSRDVVDRYPNRSPKYGLVLQEGKP